jgi:hypothetical protein
METNKYLNIDDYYSTSDLALVAAISLYYPIEAIDKADPRKATFMFKREEKLDQFVEAYWRGELKVNPAAYFNQLKSCKSRLYGNDL